MTTATEDSEATVEIPFDLLTTVVALAGLSGEKPGTGTYEAHEIRDALAELYADLNSVESRTVEAWRMDPDRVNNRALELVAQLMERAGHG